MKTMDELYNTVIASDELKKEFVEAGKNEASLKALLEKYECSATVAEVETFLKEKMASDRDLSPEDLQAAAGGSKEFAENFYTSFSIVGCAITYTIEENS